MPAAAYNTRASKRGDAARGILASAELIALANQEGVPTAKLVEISEREQAGKSADHEQRTRQAESKTRQEVFDREYAQLLKEFTIFRQRRETRKAELKGPEQHSLLAILTVDRARKIQVERVDKEGKTTTSVEESGSSVDRLLEIVEAVGAVLAQKELVNLFAAVEYGDEKLSALKSTAEGLQATQSALSQTRREAESATQQEHDAVSALNELWALYGPSLRRAGNKSPSIKALLQST